MEWERNPKSFLCAVVFGIYKNSIRKNARHERLAPSESMEGKEEGVRDFGKDMEQEYLQKELNGKIRECIDLLPEKYRLSLILYYILEMSLVEAAHVMKVPQGTVKSRLFKGRKLMRKRLEGIGIEGI